jgi:hypothetical protein
MFGILYTRYSLFANNDSNVKLRRRSNTSIRRTRLNSLIFSDAGDTSSGVIIERQLVSSSVAMYPSILYQLKGFIDKFSGNLSDIDMSDRQKHQVATQMILKLYVDDNTATKELLDSMRSTDKQALMDPPYLPADFYNVREIFFLIKDYLACDINHPYPKVILSNLVAFMCSHEKSDFPVSSTRAYILADGYLTDIAGKNIDIFNVADNVREKIQSQDSRNIVSKDAGLGSSNSSGGSDIDHLSSVIQSMEGLSATPPPYDYDQFELLDVAEDNGDKKLPHRRSSLGMGST